MADYKAEVERRIEQFRRYLESLRRWRRRGHGCVKARTRRKGFWVGW